MFKVKNTVYDKKPLQQAVTQVTNIWATHEGRGSGIGASNFFNKVISELLAVDVNIDEEDKALILLRLLSQSYDHIITTMLYSKKTLILEEVTSTLLSNENRKRPNQEEQEGLGMVVTRQNGRGEGKKNPDLSKAYQFCHREGHWKND